MIFRIERHHLGRRLHICGKRIHHYHHGAALILAGAWLMWVDRRDIYRALI